MGLVKNYREGVGHQFFSPQLPSGGGVGWVILFHNRDRHTFKSLDTTGTVGHSWYIKHSELKFIVLNKKTLKRLVSFLKCNFNKMCDFFLNMPLPFNILLP